MFSVGKCLHWTSQYDCRYSTIFTIKKHGNTHHLHGKFEFCNNNTVQMENEIKILVTLVSCLLFSASILLVIHPTHFIHKTKLLINISCCQFPMSFFTFVELFSYMGLLDFMYLIQDTYAI